MPMSRLMIHGALGDEAGLTLVEALIVMLVIANLAAIAIPAFADQSRKAHDAGAKATAHTAELTIETCRLSSITGSYEGCDAAALRSLEPSLPPPPALKVSNLAAGTYTIVAQSQPASQKFRVKRNAKGVLSFPCATKNVGGCPADGDWSE